MPAQGDKPHVDAGRRRVRTGCLTCRRRRRKCDETKPRCLNCKGKSLTCRYGVNLVFLDSTPECFSGRRRQDSPAPAPTSNTPEQEDGAETRDQDGLANAQNEKERVIDPTEPPRASFSPLPSPYQPPQDHGVQIINTANRVDRDVAPKTDNNHLVNDDATAVRFDNHSNQSFRLSQQHNQPQDNTPTLDTLSEGAPTALSVPASTSPQVSAASVLRHGDNELDLLRHYRQHIAPLLDLGLGGQYYGVGVLTSSSESSELRRAIIALSAGHKATWDSAVPPFNRSMSISGNIAPEHASHLSQNGVTAALFSAWMKIYTIPPESWSYELCNLQSQLSHFVLDPDQWHVLARLVMASMLLSSDSNGAMMPLMLQLPPCRRLSHGSLPIENGFLQALTLLQRSLEFTTRSKQSNFPAASAWQLCWSENQVWYATRPLALQQILDVPESDIASLESTNAGQFPVVLFSNTCAFIANVVHHLTCLVLLQHKFRTVQAIAEADSSISPIWHARRIIGICASTEEKDKWDPLVIAAIVHASQIFSHQSQLSVVVDILRRASREGKLRLDDEIARVTS